MNIEEFLSTLYLGDRYLKEIVIDSYEKEVKFKINLISRMRGEEGDWNYYNEENIEDGYIVFSGVKSFMIEPLGYIPNDEICDREIFELDNDMFKIVYYIGSYDDIGEYKETTVTLEAKEVCLEDPANNQRIYT